MSSPSAFVVPPLSRSLHSATARRGRCSHGPAAGGGLVVHVPGGGLRRRCVAGGGAAAVRAGADPLDPASPLVGGEDNAPSATPSPTSSFTTNGDVSAPTYIVPDALVSVACAAADAAGAEVRRWFRSPSLTVETKADTSPVTAADRAVEAAVRTVLAARVPDHAVLGEEGDGADAFATADVGADVDPDAPTGREVFTWVVDPIDGTKSFMTGKATFGTLLALLRNGVPVLGIIDQPIMRERWVGAVGRPTELRTGGGDAPDVVQVVVKGAPSPSVRAAAESSATDAAPVILTAPTRTLSDAAARLSEADAAAVLSKVFIYATAPEMFIGPDVLPFGRVAAAAKHMLYGADCYGYALLASGHTDAVVEADLKPWDYLALIPVIQGAGGSVTDWSGAPLDVHSDGRVVAAANPAVHAAALRVLAGTSGLPPTAAVIAAQAAADARATATAAGTAAGAAVDSADAAAAKEADLDEALKLPHLERRVWDVKTVGNGAVTGIAVDPLAMLDRLAGGGAESASSVPPTPSSPLDRGAGYVESMTGFGQAVIDDGHTWAVHVELRSVNSRFCDVNLRLPRYLSNYETEFTAAIKSSLVRGKIIAGVDVRRLQATSDDEASNGASTRGPSTDAGAAIGSDGGNVERLRGMPIRVDVAAVRSIRALLNEVAATAGLTGPAAEPSLADVLSFSEVFTKRESEDAAGAVLPLVRSALAAAIEDLRSSRRREGAALEAALDVCVSQIQTMLTEVEARAPVRVEKERRRLRERLMAALGYDVAARGGGPVNESRLELELAVAADRLDVSEEVVRLQSHVQLFQLSFVGVNGPIGSRLNFLTQEMHREASTIAAKANDSAMAQCAIRIKEELERMREQVQNIR